MIRIVWLVLALLLAAAPALSDPAKPDNDDPRVWLHRMSTAVDDLNYKGTFVHMMNDNAETMRVIHRSQDGRVRERLLSLDGSGKEIISNGTETRCILQEQRKVLVERHDGANPLRTALPTYNRALEDFYAFNYAGEGRVAGRVTRVIEVRPRDAYRYGYRLWLDEVTAMPLQSVLLDDVGDVIERVFFTEVEFPEFIADAELEPTISGEGFEWHVREARVEKQGGEVASPAWVAEQVPEGFQLSAATREESSDGPQEEHLVYTDGLASVSIFVEDAPEDRQSMSGLVRVGPANTYSTMHGKYQVTVVGEVPASTVRMMGSSLRSLREQQR